MGWRKPSNGYVFAVWVRIWRKGVLLVIVSRACRIYSGIDNGFDNGISVGFEANFPLFVALWIAVGFPLLAIDTMYLGLLYNVVDRQCKPRCDLSTSLSTLMQLCW